MQKRLTLIVSLFATFVGVTTIQPAVTVSPQELFQDKLDAAGLSYSPDAAIMRDTSLQAAFVSALESLRGSSSLLRAFELAYLPLLSGAKVNSFEQDIQVFASRTDLDDTQRAQLAVLNSQILNSNKSWYETTGGIVGISVGVVAAAAAVVGGVMFAKHHKGYQFDDASKRRVKAQLATLMVKHANTADTAFGDVAGQIQDVEFLTALAGVKTLEDAQRDAKLMQLAAVVKNDANPFGPNPTTLEQEVLALAAEVRDRIANHGSISRVLYNRLRLKKNLRFRNLLNEELHVAERLSMATSIPTLDAAENDLTRQLGESSISAAGADMEMVSAVLERMIAARRHELANAAADNDDQSMSTAGGAADGGAADSDVGSVTSDDEDDVAQREAAEAAALERQREAAEAALVAQQAEEAAAALVAQQAEAEAEAAAALERQREADEAAAALERQQAEEAAAAALERQQAEEAAAAALVAQQAEADEAAAALERQREADEAAAALVAQQEEADLAQLMGTEDEPGDGTADDGVTRVRASLPLPVGGVGAPAPAPVDGASVTDDPVEPFGDIVATSGLFGSDTGLEDADEVVDGDAVATADDVVDTSGLFDENSEDDGEDDAPYSEAEFEAAIDELQADFESRRPTERSMRKGWTTRAKTAMKQEINGNTRWSASHRSALVGAIKGLTYNQTPSPARHK